jgi:hypothetical protein
MINIFLKGKAFIKGGAAYGRTSLCATCASAHIVAGYRDSEMVVICTEATPHLTVRFEVKECTKYEARNRPAPAPRKLGFFVDELTTCEDEPELTGIEG